MSPRRGFTLIDVLACLIVMTVGLMSAIGMLLYGLQLAKLSLGRATGLATAMSVAVDPRPLLGSDPEWHDDGTTVTGYLNGFWVRRSRGAATAIAPGLAAVDVRVDVFETMLGRAVASYDQRLIEVAP